MNYAADVRRIHEAGRGKVTRGRVLQFGDSLSGAADMVAHGPCRALQAAADLLAGHSGDEMQRQHDPQLFRQLLQALAHGRDEGLVLEGLVRRDSEYST